MQQTALFLKPVLKDYIWGGERLKEDYGFESEYETVAESWMLSCHKDGTNTIAFGEYKGETLENVLKKWGYAEKFPILIKFIDAKEALSVQVHPDNDYALKNEGEFGKTEMWYVIDCAHSAKLAYGFNREIDKNEFRKRIVNNTLDEVINYVPVKKGDVFFITAGTLHAIGAGILIAEIQQNSNCTYRVSDYGRLGKDGKPRELHIDKAVDVTKTEKPKLPYGAIGRITEYSYGTERELSQCEYFKTVKLNLNGEKTIKTENAFLHLLVLSGSGVLKCGKDVFDFKPGDSILLPPDFKSTISGKAEIIYTETDKQTEI